MCVSPTVTTLVGESLYCSIAVSKFTTSIYHINISAAYSETGGGGGSTGGGSHERRGAGVEKAEGGQCCTA